MVSAYTEAELGFAKPDGDLIGPCLFAAAMGVSRSVFGKFGLKMNLTRQMTGPGIL